MTTDAQRRFRKGAARTAPMRTGKVVRWVQHLTDPQVVELTRRLSRAMLEGHDINPGRLRAVLVGFIEHQPEVRDDPPQPASSRP